MYYRYCLNTVCVCVCVPTYNGYWLPGKAQPATDADVFTAAAGWPKADKIFHAEEHHKDDLLPDRKQGKTQMSQKAVGR